ncbi:MAG: alpha-ketoglutarate-dependent dioxygenase AlkB [Pseudomonadota bacterium]
MKNGSHGAGHSGTATVLGGAHIYHGFLGKQEQASMVADIRTVVSRAPLFHPETRWGKKMSVGMTSAGEFGWISDRRGYRYGTMHPLGVSWPPIPASILEVWNRVSGSARSPECCLVNYYRDGAKMGLHQDRDEADTTEPVVSISLGDEALFRIGGVERGGPTKSVWLLSGDVVVMGGQARLAYHGIDRIRFGSSRVLKDGGRINLTLRVVT